MSIDGLTLSGTALDPSASLSGAPASPPSASPAPAPSPAPIQQAPAPSVDANGIPSNFHPGADTQTPSSPSLVKRLALGALMGLAHGGLGGAVVGALEGVSKHEFGRMQQAEQNADTIRNAAAQKAQTDAETEGQFRQAQLRNMSAEEGLHLAQTHLADQQINSFDTDKQQTYRKNLVDQVADLTKTYGVPPDIVPSHGETVTEYINSLPDASRKSKFVLADGDQFYVFDKSSMMQNYQQMANDINDARRLRSPKPAQVTGQMIAANPKMYEKEYDDALSTFNPQGGDLSKSRALETSLGTAIDRMQGESDVPPGLLEKATRARDSAHLLAERDKKDKTDIAAVEAQQKQNITNANPTTVWLGQAKDGSWVAGAPEELKASGVTNYQKMPTDEVNKMNTARALISGPDAAFNQLADALHEVEKNGDLGTLASRWNDFRTGKLGTSPDSDFAHLRTALGLTNTALMQVHVGARGNSALLEHFEDLANAKRMNADTLRAALQTEYRYVRSKAMLPKGQ